MARKPRRNHCCQKSGVPIVGINPLGAGFSDEERLKLGTFVADRSAEAIASGDKFFQRHAAILGSTGSGKSWAVALILERAAKLKYPNIVVFDMHGEYRPLADKSKGGFAKALSEGMDPVAAVRFGRAKERISVTRAGTAPSMLVD